MVNLAQNASHMSLPAKVVVPALLRGSKLFSIAADRWLHPVELLGVQGMPVMLPKDNIYAAASPFQQHQPSFKTITKMAGNAMHVGAVGGIKIMVLGSMG